ncbi:MAG TPA: ArsR family transcriptional regulator [Candidatus Marinimicrobia bacterium]|nr:ArsR family transcriptional regulator [Candidatus Neomarinimicrobiota bacterium]
MPEIDTCEISFIDENKVKAVQRNIPLEGTVNQLSVIFKLMGDPTRLKIILALSMEELCVCDIALLLGLTRSAISHQLRLLRGPRLVKFRRAGKLVYYSLDDQHVKHLLKDGLEHLSD